MTEEVVILMNDCPGTKLPGKLSSTVGKFIAPFSNPSPHNVLRGELLVPLKNKHSSQNDGPPQPNYFVKKDPSIILYCTADDISPLDRRESWFLEGIESTYERHALFIEGTKTEWGPTLVVSDTVYASIPGPNPVVRKCATANIRYIGEVKGLSGYQFGIEILDGASRGNGTSDGTFNGTRYFHCEDKCGLFVSLDKLSLNPIPEGIQGQRQKTAATTNPSYASALGSGSSGPPSNNTRSKAATESSADPPSRPCRFNINEKVVIHDKRGNEVHGTVCWWGMKTVSRNFGFMVVGIATETKVSVKDFEENIPGLGHLISAPKNHSLFLPESLVTSLQDKTFPGKKNDSAVDLNSSISVAKIFGVSRNDLMREQTEGMRQAQEKLSATDASRGPGHQQRAQQQGVTHTPQMAHLDNEQKIRKQISQSGDHYEPIPGGSPSPAERGNLRGQRPSAPIEHRSNVQDPYSRQGNFKHEPQQQQQHDNLHKNATVTNRDPELDAFHHSPGPSNTHAPQNQRGPTTRDSGPGAFQNTSASQNLVSQNSPMLQENVPTPAYRTKPPVIDQQHVAAVVSSPSQPSHWQPLDKGSTIQIPSTEYGHPMRYGVIRWIGELPGVQGLIAGVELDEEMEGCTDGTWSTTGQAFFHCPPGKGLYYGLYNLKPDSRFNSASSISLNPLAEVSDFEENDQALTDPSRQIDKYFGEGRGIQGHQNSCYLDATVFGLFALSSEFDDMFLEETSDPIRNQIRSMLWKGIVNPLRKNGVVKYESVMRLRKKLEELEKMKGITEDEKDPEEFLNMLFKHTLQITPFISINRPFGVEQEFFVQLFLEFDESMKLPTVGDLLKKMFKEQSISFTEVPPKLLIQVPRFGKQFKTFEKVVPALTLNIADVVDIPCAHLCYNCEKPTKTECMDCKTEFPKGPGDVVYFCDDCCKTVHSVERRKQHKVSWCEEVQSLLQVSELELLSVICIETSHYVCFTRCEDRWVFFDSMANRVHDQFNIPKVVECTNVLNDWIYPANGDLSRLLKTPSRELPEYVRRFTQDVYLCIYIQPDVGMY